MVKDYYRILGVSDNAEDVVIHAAFRLLAHRHHPDKQLENKEQANRIMSDINEAYQHLSAAAMKANHGRVFETDLDWYQVLGVLPHVDAQMIHVTYEALARKYRNSPARLNEINHAYRVLADAGKRKSYDVQQQSLADARKRMLADFSQRSSSGVSKRQVYDFKRQRPVVYSRRTSRFLWKIYFTYLMAFYVLMAVFFILTILH
ncbi:MAG: J domain-containing protein [Methylobacter sp.]